MNIDKIIKIFENEYLLNFSEKALELFKELLDQMEQSFLSIDLSLIHI